MHGSLLEDLSSSSSKFDEPTSGYSAYIDELGPGFMFFKPEFLHIFPDDFLA
jgi:hypothetical protein